MKPRSAEQTTRGGLKMEAAIETFGLASKIRGANAIDVGASTGGFVRALLRHGARAVTAVDVGHDQLAAELRADARVTNLERTDFKRASLTVAPGPFDVFSVDVSFVAARNMLRGLAFRLRPGAEGFVLIKPQFELPSSEVKGGDVSDPALRARAVARFREKAAELGFTIVRVEDSPVAGGSGTVELLAHLRFDGRPEHLPRLGEKKPERVAPAKAKAARAPVAAARTEAVTWYAVAAPGLEDVALAEVTRLPGATDVRKVTGGVEFRGPWEVGLRANLSLAVATRVLVRLGSAPAREFAQLRRRLATLPWERYVPADVPVRVDATVTRCRLFHTGALAEQVALAIGDRLGRKIELAPRGADEDADAETSTPAVTRVLLRGEENEFHASVDASGELLHKRGWRTEAGRAPLRETLAAGILALAEFRAGEEALVDAMTGAGTIAIEAARLACGRAPGLGRAFACERWPIADAARAAALRAEAGPTVAPSNLPAVVGYDRDAEVLERARRNAERADVAGVVTFVHGELASSKPPAPGGLLVANPPYGRRLGSGPAANAAYRDLGRALRGPYQGWRAAILAPHPSLAKTVGLPLRASHALRNGGLRVTLLIFDAVTNNTGSRRKMGH